MENGLTGTKNASPCKNGQKILYAWAKDAPKLDLPEGVGFKVGGKDSDVNYLVLQVHTYNKRISLTTEPIWFSFTAFHKSWEGY